jgi:uncharacterized protein (UPF0335 family)
MAERLIDTKGSNGPGREQFEAAVREIVVARQKAETAQAVLRNAFKRAQNQGFDLKQLKVVLAMRDRDPVELEQEMAVQRRYMLWAGLPVGTQMEMFGAGETGQAEREAQEDGLSDTARQAKANFEAEQRGYACGRRGGDMRGENPFPAGAEEFVEFERGFWRGQEAIAMEMVPKDAPKRRGRPPKKAKEGNPEDGPPQDDDGAGAGDAGTVH